MGWRYKAGRERLTPYQSKHPSPKTQTYRKKEENWKIIEDKKVNKTVLALLLKPASSINGLMN